ncbi:type I methionyl aminopeptidase [bacterium]|nr:type I methionyl aminopeptidase [bacterium]OIO83665.1 MAG: type I methionyl aminopeptidase [Anaerolineae bacterium CG2_30_58_95]PIU91366.1 MAG: type I methionyl aminopeptidase [Anaerolineae bacterium CG06_land_8_20_14_3_00_57_67]PIW20767.1 MAG: type I methionyl aminopeptidase [Anaerolineae bacterium CG17_big_fil_post_rev_8_21_14_2_50_57_27]PIX47813.1 MAG: type I methionyl aminopeptidase [Anaerolineae bacterium CG_4_8_14_3_um_filter_59_70]PJH74428.1 MAG: type I methionyl aminopeptidase [Anae
MDWARQINVKNPAEIALMREAGRVNALALAAVRELIEPGVTTADLNAAAEEVLRKHGAYSPFYHYGRPPFPASICASVNEELVHGIPGNRKLKEGDIISVDCGAVVEGYVGDASFTAGIGELSSTARKLLEVTEKALYIAIEKMRVGNHTGDVSAAIQQFVEGRGFHVTREYTGHGVGRQMHEGPQVPNYGKPGTGVPLEAGMTIALEPMVLVGTHRTRVLPNRWTVVSADGSLTAHFEHSIAVTEGEPLILTVL